jgi:hypothetical protein
MDEGLKDEWKSLILSPFVFSIKKAMSNTRFNKLNFAENDSKAKNPQQRGIQRPRVFYRRELEARPFIVAKP